MTFHVRSLEDIALVINMARLSKEIYRFNANSRRFFYLYRNLKAHAKIHMEIQETQNIQKILEKYRVGDS